MASDPETEIPISARGRRLKSTMDDCNFVYTGRSSTGIRNAEKDKELGPVTQNLSLDPSMSEQKMSTYALNKVRTIDKKIEASDRQPMEVEQSNSNTVLTLSASCFETAHKCLVQYYSENLYSVKRSQKVDTNGLVQEDTMRIVRKSDGVKLAINLYRTTSRALINGASLDLFQKEHFPVLAGKILQDYDRNQDRAMKDCMQTLKAMEQEGESTTGSI